MLLYHGTNGLWLSNILSKGLEPRLNRPGRNNWKHVKHQSNAKCVYLTNSYAPYFAFNAANSSNSGWCAVLEIDTDLLNSNNLYPDEDCLEQVGRRLNDGVPGDLSQRTLYYRSKQFADHGLTITSQNRLFNWADSIKLMGTCSHKGTIPTKAITRSALWPHKNDNLLLQFVWDPSITIINQAICGNRYQALTSKLFGDAPHNKLQEFDQITIDSFDPNKIDGLQIQSYK